MSVTITQYTSGKTPFRDPLTDPVSMKAALTDAVNRILEGAIFSPSGFNPGLAQWYGPDDAPTGSAHTIYGGATNKFYDLLVKASQPTKSDRQEHIRRSALQVCKLELTEEDLAIAQALTQDEFLEIMALAIETDEDVTEYIRAAAPTSA